MAPNGFAVLVIGFSEGSFFYLSSIHSGDLGVYDRVAAKPWFIACADLYDRTGVFLVQMRLVSEISCFCSGPLLSPIAVICKYSVLGFHDRQGFSGTLVTMIES